MEQRGATLIARIITARLEVSLAIRGNASFVPVTYFAVAGSNLRIVQNLLFCATCPYYTKINWYRVDVSLRVDEPADRESDNYAHY